MKQLLFFIFLCFACRLGTFGQTSLNDTIEQAKGSLLLPLSKYNQIININGRKSEYAFDRTDSSLSFVTDSAYNVKACFATTVLYILNYRNNEYCIITKYGDYYINYCRLAKPYVKPGEQVIAGQILGKLTKEEDELQYRLDFSMNKFDSSVNVYEWLKL